MDDYYDRVEQQLRALTIQGAHRQPRVRMRSMVAIVAATAVVIVVAGVFLGVRARSPTPPASSAPVPACQRADWRMTAIAAQQLDGATVAGASIRVTQRCRLQLVIRFDLVNRSGALASAVSATVDASVKPGAAIERRWAWRNGCDQTGRFWFRLSASHQAIRVRVSPPPCVNRRASTGFGLFKLDTPAVLNNHGIGPARFRTPTALTLESIGNLLGVFGDRTGGRGCGVDRGEHMLDDINLFFGQGRFVGYEYRGHFLTTTTGLRVGDTITRARRLYGAAFTTSAAQGGSWSAEGLRGYLTAPRNGRIATIDAGDVGCAALSP